MPPLPAAPAAPEIDADPADPDFMTSFARGLQVIRAFSEHRHHLTISQVSQTTGLPRASARRCLHTLVKLGYAGAAGKRFFLRPQVLALGNAYLSSTPIAATAQPWIDEVSTALGESCSLAVLDGDDIVYICRSAEQRIMSINLLVGSRLPACFTSMGRVLLAHQPPEALKAYLARVRLVAYTERTLVTRAALRRAIAQARDDGFAILDQELEAGVRSIAVPVRDARGEVIAALNVGAHASRASLDAMRERFLPALRQCAASLSGVLAG